MKSKRQAKILEIISKYNIKTQEELSEHLEQEGFHVTQATVSRDIRELKPEKSVYRELCLIKVRSTPEKRQGVIAVADIFRAKIVDVNVDSLIVELTGNQSKIQAFIDLLQDYEILEIARTGIAGLGRGTENLVHLE